MRVHSDRRSCTRSRPSQGAASTSHHSSGMMKLTGTNYQRIILANYGGKQAAALIKETVPRLLGFILS